jgi:hypothetical protein
MCQAAASFAGWRSTLEFAMHSRLMVPIGKQLRFTVDVDGKIRMDAFAHTFRVFILAHYLLIQVPPQL